MIDDEAYASIFRGDNCPYCLSSKEVYHYCPNEECGPKVHQGFCGMCGKRWEDVYKLIGYRELKVVQK